MPRYAKKLVLQWEEDKSRDISEIDVTDSDVAAKHFREMIGYPPNEKFAVIALNAQMDYLGEAIVNSGTSMMSVVDVPAVLKTILLSGGQAIILCHNHPNCDTRPSDPDIRLTVGLIEICRMLQIAVIDHLIIGEGDVYFSFRSEMKSISPEWVAMDA